MAILQPVTELSESASEPEQAAQRRPSAKVLPKKKSGAPKALPAVSASRDAEMKPEEDSMPKEAPQTQRTFCEVASAHSMCFVACRVSTI